MNIKRLERLRKRKWMYVLILIINRTIARKNNTVLLNTSLNDTKDTFLFGVSYQY